MKTLVENQDLFYSSVLKQKPDFFYLKVGGVVCILVLKSCFLNVVIALCKIWLMRDLERPYSSVMFEEERFGSMKMALTTLRSLSESNCPFSESS